MKELQALIMEGNFSEAYLKIKQQNHREIYDFILDLACNSKNMVIYGFVFYLISIKENHIFHSLASDILAFPLCSFKGAYLLALFHARRALELDPENIEYLQFLILFHDIPEKLIEKEEALEIAKKVLTVDSESIVAKQIITKYSSKK